MGYKYLVEETRQRRTQEPTEVEVNLRPTVSRPVCPGVRRPSGTCDQFFFLLEISFRQLQLCYFVAPSLTRGRVCNLLVQLLLGLASAATRISLWLTDRLLGKAGAFRCSIFM
jgi:hypothetical protein